VFLVFLLIFAQRLACDDGRSGEAIMIGIDDQRLTALGSHLINSRAKLNIWRDEKNWLTNNGRSSPRLSQNRRAGKTGVADLGRTALKSLMASSGS